MKELIFRKNNKIIHFGYIVKDDLRTIRIEEYIERFAIKNDTTIEHLILNQSSKESMCENCDNLQIVEYLSKENQNKKESSLSTFNNLTILRTKATISIEYKAFKNCINLHTVVLPLVYGQKSQLIIEKEAFAGCNNLRTVVFSKCNTVIEENAFTGCDFEKLTFVIVGNNNAALRYAREHGIRYVYADK